MTSKHLIARFHFGFSPRLRASLSLWFTIGLSLGLSLWLGMGFAHAIEDPYAMVDPIDTQHIASYQRYIERCATCHVALPPAVLPTQTWQVLIHDSAHYGVTLPLMSHFDQRLILNYLQPYSYPSQSRSIPFRLKDSAYFGALHPDVELPEPLNLRSCLECHAGAGHQNYRATDHPA
ncbi:MAG: diheme cytochrome C [Phormidesmis sp. RL_2_1]|nr:diheme cytochrome C [Phormidesmis sp. RL_2_1]